MQGVRSRRTRLLVVVAALIALLTACLPDPSRDEGIGRAASAAQLFKQTPGFDAHMERLSPALTALLDVPELQPHWDQLVALHEQMLPLPPGTAATALRTEIDAVAAQILAEPAAAPALADLQAALQAVRDDVPAGDALDATLRGMSDAGLTPATYFPPKVGVFGDSAAYGLRYNSSAYTGTSNKTKKLRLGNGFTTIGCGTLMTNSTCGTAAQWGARVSNNGAHIALVYSGIWETKCWQFEDWTECHHLGEPIFDDYIRRNLDARTEAMLQAGATRVIYVKTNRGPGTDGIADSTNLDRWQRWRDLLDEHAARYDHVQALDLLPFWAADPARDATLRPDGYHFTTNAWMFWRDALEPMLFWDYWLPRWGRQYHNYAAWAPVLGQLWSRTTAPPRVTGPGLSTTTTTSPPTTTTTSPPTTAPATTVAP